MIEVPDKKLRFFPTKITVVVVLKITQTFAAFAAAVAVVFVNAIILYLPKTN